MPSPLVAPTSTLVDSPLALKFPIAAIGKDPSLSVPNEAFGINLNKGANTILKGILPPGLSPGDREDVAAVFLDGVGCPGKETSDDSGTMAHMSVAFEEFAHMLQQDQSGRTHRKNLRWKTPKILSLKEPQTHEELKEIDSEIRDAKGAAYTLLTDSLEAIFEKYPWAPPTIHAWSHGGYLVRMAKDTLDWYHDLVQHLLSVSTCTSWSMA